MFYYTCFVSSVSALILLFYNLRPVSKRNLTIIAKFNVNKIFWVETKVWSNLQLIWYMWGLEFETDLSIFTLQLIKYNSNTAFTQVKPVNLNGNRWALWLGVHPYQWIRKSTLDMV